MRILKGNKKAVLAGFLTIFSAGIFFTTGARALLYVPTEEVVIPAEEELKIPAHQINAQEYPERLIIPALGIDTEIQHVGLTTDGKMASPNNFHDVGWYKYGPVPGQRGSAVVTGHVDNGLALDGVFKSLKNIKAGDDIYIRTKEGTTIHFSVSDVESYPLAEIPLEHIFNRNDAPRLNLITCDGKWLSKEKTYDHRLIVYAKM